MSILGTHVKSSASAASGTGGGHSTAPAVGGGYASSAVAEKTDYSEVSSLSNLPIKAADNFDSYLSKLQNICSDKLVDSMEGSDGLRQGPAAVTDKVATCSAPVLSSL